MALFKKKVKNYQSIIAPLAKMRQDLIDYVTEQGQRIETLTKQKSEIESEILVANLEIGESEKTAKNLSTLININDDPSNTQ